MIIKIWPLGAVSYSARRFSYLFPLARAANEKGRELLRNIFTATSKLLLFLYAHTNLQLWIPLQTTEIPQGAFSSSQTSHAVSTARRV